MSKRFTNKKSGRRWLHPYLQAYNDLASAYKEAFPDTNHDEEKEVTKNHGDKCKDNFGLDMELRYTWLLSFCVQLLQYQVYFTCINNI